VTAIGPNLHLSRRKYSALILTLLAIVVVVAAGIVYHQQIKNQLNAWKLLPQPERLTELYFTAPNNLPSAYTPGQKQNVRFTVHNIEYQTETYQYKIVETNQDGSQSQQLSSGQFTLQQDQYEGLNVGVTPVDMGKRAKIIIELPTISETIGYWAEQQS